MNKPIVCGNGHVDVFEIQGSPMTEHWDFEGPKGTLRTRLVQIRVYHCRVCGTDFTVRQEHTYTSDMIEDDLRDDSRYRHT